VRTKLMATNYSHHAAVDNWHVLKELDLLGTLLEFQKPGSVVTIGEHRQHGTRVNSNVFWRGRQKI
jgi:hypothetical protein